MRAAVLCPGPSLAKTWNPSYGKKYQVVIAVNRAALVGPFDWWVAGDWSIYKTTEATPSVGFCSTKDILRTITDAGGLIPLRRRPENYRMIPWEDLPVYDRFSSISALGLAFHLKARCIDIYGDGKVGALDFDGVPAGANRSDDRWAQERVATNKAVRKIQNAGCSMEWIT